MPPAPRIELARRAVRDLRRMDTDGRRRTEAGIANLADGAENLDVKAIARSAPWWRLRVGEWRVLYRPLSRQEAPEGGLLVARVIDRRELERAVRSL